MFGKKKQSADAPVLSPLVKDFIAAAAPVEKPVDEILQRKPSEEPRKKEYPFVPTTARGIDYMVEMRIREWVLKNGGENR